MPSWKWQKAGLAELPEEHEAAGQTEGLGQRLQLGAGQRPELLQNPGDGVAGDKAVGIGLDALLPQFCEFLQALVAESIGLCHGVSA